MAMQLVSGATAKEETSVYTTYPYFYSAILITRECRELIFRLYPLGFLTELQPEPISASNRLYAGYEDEAARSRN